MAVIWKKIHETWQHCKLFQTQSVISTIVLRIGQEFIITFNWSWTTEGKQTFTGGHVTEVTRISVQPLYFIYHTPTVLYNQKYKEYEITKNVEISTK